MDKIEDTVKYSSEIVLAQPALKHTRRPGCLGDGDCML